MEQKANNIRVFLILGIVFALVIFDLYIKVLIDKNYSILTTEEEVDSFKTDNFGLFADYI